MEAAVGYPYQRQLSNRDRGGARVCCETVALALASVAPEPGKPCPAFHRRCRPHGGSGPDQVWKETQRAEDFV